MENGEWNCWAARRFHLPSSIAIFVFCFSWRSPFSSPAARRRDRARCWPEKNFWIAAITPARCAQLKTATTLLATNAAAWNYYGVALQCAGQPADAARAYQNALKFDRDLVEAHYNLGCLWLEQNKPDAARTEFTAYTLRRGNAPEGWLKLGAAQLKLHDLLAAERSFSTAYSLNTNNAEALNGLGLARVAGGRRRTPRNFSPPPL